MPMLKSFHHSESTMIAAFPMQNAHGGADRGRGRGACTSWLWLDKVGESIRQKIQVFFLAKTNMRETPLFS